MGKEKKKDKKKKKISPEQLLEAIRQQNVMTSLSEPKGINELQYSLSKITMLFIMNSCSAFGSLSE